jgi:undecaprenyl-diphosphatase
LYAVVSRDTLTGESRSIQGQGVRVLDPLDAAILGFFNQFAQRSYAFDSIVALLETNTLVKGGLAMAVFWWLWMRHDSTTEDRQHLLFGLVSSFTAVLISRALALSLPFRQRPMHDALLNFRIPYSLNLNTLIGWSSFPSDHAALYFSLAVTFIFVSRRVGLAALAYTCIVICFPRVYLGIHYPTDLLAGAIIGVLVAMLGQVRQLRDAVTNPIMRLIDTQRAFAYSFLFICTLSLAKQFEPFRQVGKVMYKVAKFTMYGHA